MFELSSPIIYAIGASLCAGIYSFVGKIATERGYDPLFYAFHSIVISLPLGGILFLRDFGNFSFQSDELLAAMVLGVVDVSTFIFMMKSLSYLSSSLVFINYRVISSLLLILVGIFFFGEEITFINYIGFILGFSVFFLLYDNEKQEKKQYQVKKGAIYLLLGIGGVVISHTCFKILAADVHIESFYFFRAIVSTIFVGTLICILKKGLLTLPKKKKDIFLPAINVAFFTVYYMFFLQKAYELGNLSISYKIISYSVFIPIILSMIFYGEKLTPKRMIAIVITLISLLFFMY